MSGSGSESSIISGMTFNANNDYIYTKPKVNASGGKSIGILNKETMKGLYISTPLMLTWGVNSFTDENNNPDLTITINACKTVARALKEKETHPSSSKPVIIFESTFYPGTTEEVCLPILKLKSGLCTFSGSLSEKTFIEKQVYCREVWVKYLSKDGFSEQFYNYLK